MHEQLMMHSLRFPTSYAHPYTADGKPGASRMREEEAGTKLRRWQHEDERGVVMRTLQPAMRQGAMALFVSLITYPPGLYLPVCTRPLFRAPAICFALLLVSAQALFSACSLAPACPPALAQDCLAAAFPCVCAAYMPPRAYAKHLGATNAYLAVQGLIDAGVSD